MEIRVNLWPYNHRNQALKIRTKKPAWLRRRLPAGPEFEHIRQLVDQGGLHTVCQAARCPNIWECFSRQTATFLILGDRCTRNCRFCAVGHQPEKPPDPEEPGRVAKAAGQMNLRYVVITSVTRDDVPDGGAGHFAETIRQIRLRLPEARVEVLIPDFQGSPDSLQTVLAAKPDVLNHNIETVPRLYPTVRPGAVYARSMELIRSVSRFTTGIPSKSGLMLGLGEKAAEIKATLGDLRVAECSFLTLGQYLQPSAAHLPVERYVAPEEFDDWKEKALAMGFKEVASGPFVRSSYHADSLYNASKT